MPNDKAIILKPKLAKSDIAEESAWIHGPHSVTKICSSIHGDNGQPVHRCDTIDIAPSDGCELNVSMSDGRVFIVVRKRKTDKAWQAQVLGVHEGDDA